MINISKNTDSIAKTINEEQNTPLECFVIMPITTRQPYEGNHFQIVYDHLIKPACILAGFNPIRSDEIKNTNFIVKDILKRLLDSPMAICDLSGQNPNVLFELGIRQSFNKPVTIIKDILTPRIFDIDGLRCIEYNENLRVDIIGSSIKLIAETLINTYEAKENKENSLIEALSITPAKIPEERTLSNDTSILLESIQEMRYQIETLFRSQTRQSQKYSYYPDPEKCNACDKKDNCDINPLNNRYIDDRYAHGSMIIHSTDDVSLPLSLRSQNELKRKQSRTPREKEHIKAITESNT